MPPSGVPARNRRASSSIGASPSPSTTRSNGPSSNMSSGLKVASMPPATMYACGVMRRARCASSRSKHSVMPVVETPMTSQEPSTSSCSSARAGGPAQQLGSNTLAVYPCASSTPASRHTPRGGARNVYSPQCGSYGPINRTLGGSPLQDPWDPDSNFCNVQAPASRPAYQIASQLHCGKAPVILPAGSTANFVLSGYAVANEPRRSGASGCGRSIRDSRARGALLFLLATAFDRQRYRSQQLVDFFLRLRARSIADQ